MVQTKVKTEYRQRNFKNLTEERSSPRVCRKESQRGVNFTYTNLRKAQGFKAPGTMQAAYGGGLRRGLFDPWPLSST